MLRLQRKIKNLKTEINDNKLLLTHCNKQLKEKFLSPMGMMMTLLFSFSVGYYFNYQKKRHHYSFFRGLKKAALSTFTFYKKIIMLL